MMYTPLRQNLFRSCHYLKTLRKHSAVTKPSTHFFTNTFQQQQQTPNAYNRQFERLFTTSDQSDRIKELEQENEKLKAELKKLEEKGKKKGFMGMLREYGMPFFVWWTTLYVGSGLGIYAAIEHGMLGGADVIDLIQIIGLDQHIDMSRLNPAYGNMALAFMINELLEAVRLPFTIATTPMIAKRFRGAEKN